MRIPLSWVSLYSPLDSLLEKYSIKDLAHAYSIHTAEIDGIETHFHDKVVVGKVLSCEKHPESKKLSIVEVDLGDHGKTTILTGAPNIAEATYVPVAMVGAVLPGDFVIGERMMAGMMSRGMICGADEISMSKEESTGIMILEQDWERDTLESMVGKSFFDLSLPFPGKNGETYHYHLKDTTFEIDNKFITNRPDLFSVVGNAREFHAVFETPLSAPVIPANAGIQGVDTQTSPVGRKLDTKIETDKVLSYHLLKMEDISVSKSPYGISLMMERSGLAPKMDIVDMTNLIMTELGQPMHAFDAEKITGNISVRMAKSGEKILALNNIEYTLTPDDMVIADDAGPVAIAGVIGGLSSAVSETTTSVIWESACFDATSVRLTAQRHGIRTDASTRYEKSLDPILAGTTFSRVMDYLDFLGKTPKIIGSSHYLDASQVKHIELDVSYRFLEEKIGKTLEKGEILSILGRLGFETTDHGESIHIVVPSWRSTKDISRKEDIAEEVARVVGYESIDPTPLPKSKSILSKNEEILLRNMTLDHFRREKWHEVYNYSFSSESLDKKILLADMQDAIGIQNAFNEEYTHMRRSLAPRLLLAAAENRKYSDNFGFFEIGNVYGKNLLRDDDLGLLESIQDKPFPEKKMIAGVRIGSTIGDLRECLESYLRNILGYVPPIHADSKLPFLHPGIRGSYMLGDTSILTFGAIHPAVADAFGLSEKVLYFEVDCMVLLSEMRKKDLRFQPISRYQVIPRELNFLMPKNTPTGDVARVLDAIHPWIMDVHVASVYEDSEKLGEGIKSVNFSFLLSSHTATISDEEAGSIQNLIIEEMAKHGFALRSV